MGKLYLAPMEGVADCVLRDVLTRLGGYDGAVSEFIRVSNSLLPLRTFRRICPELDNGNRTPAGTPVLVQLLGSDPACMAENAAQVAELSPVGIDLNFGCPAPTVNRHGGGATLLDDPEGLLRIVAAVRQAVPPAIPVSAKMRLGVSHTDKALDCARALEVGGACSLVVHARTRDQGYRPPAHWEWVARVREVVSVPVIANGEVWTTETYALCRSITGCTDVMIGRGAIADPFLARRIKAGAREGTDRAADWQEFLPLLAEFWRQVQLRVMPGQAPGRLKQWLNSLRLTFAEAEVLYWALRPVRGIEETDYVLQQHGVPVFVPGSVPGFALRHIDDLTPFGLSRIFARRSKGVGKKQRCCLAAIVALALGFFVFLSCCFCAIKKLFVESLSKSAHPSTSSGRADFKHNRAESIEPALPPTVKA